jgi:hypothetical protein
VEVPPVPGSAPGFGGETALPVQEPATATTASRDKRRSLDSNGIVFLLRGAARQEPGR